jgi:hypothetical protein
MKIGKNYLTIKITGFSEKYGNPIGVALNKKGKRIDPRLVHVNTTKYLEKGDIVNAYKKAELYNCIICELV